MKKLNTLSESEAAQALKNGGVGIIPTDTLYGMVAVASDQVAVERLYALKSRKKKPGTLIAASIEQLVALGLKERYLKPVADYWPNPLSIIIPTGPILNYLHQGTWSIAVRIPNDNALTKFLEATGPLVTTSGNQPGKTPAKSIAQAHSIFGDDVDFYVDGGDLGDREPSTIIRIVDDMVEVVRKGAVNLSESGEIIS